MGYIVALFAVVVPLASVSVISFRMNRRAMWLLMPWSLLVVMALAVRWSLQLIGLTEDGYPSGFFMGASAVIGGWMAAGISMLSLAIVGADYPGQRILWRGARRDGRP